MSRWDRFWASSWGLFVFGAGLVVLVYLGWKFR